MTAAVAAIALAAALAVGPAELAAQPRSAIPWLSDSVRTQPPGPPPPRPPARGEPATRPADAGLAPITVTPLGAISLDAVGLVSPQASGLPRRLWGDLTADRVRDLVLDHPDLGVPASRALFKRLLLAEADPPAGPDPEAIALLARLDRLLERGALDEAEALIVAAGPATPEIFRRWFDIGLLTNRAEAQCAALRQKPGLSPTLPARVFCLARGGDWNAAEITLTLGEEVGSITPDQLALLGRFLDPVLFEEEDPPPAPRPLTALDFTLREAVGLPRPSGALPLAFLHGDLDVHAPMRARVMAGERLALAGSASPDVLFDAYRAGRPAASGGIWDRAAAVQALDAALDGGTPAAIAAALAEADATLAARGLRVAFAEVYGLALAGLDPNALPAEARPLLFELLLLGGQTDAAAAVAQAAPSPRADALLALAKGAPAPAAIEDARLAAAFRALDGHAPATEGERRAADLVAQGRAGEAILEALAALAAGPAVEPGVLETALYALSAAGQAQPAREIALQTLLLPAEG